MSAQTARLTNIQDFNTSCSTSDSGNKGVTFMPANKNKSGANSMSMRHNDDILRLKLPKMRTPFGIATGMNGKGFNIQLAFDESNVKAQECKKKCASFDKSVFKYGCDHAFEWGLVKSRTANMTQIKAVAENQFKPWVKQPKYSEKKAPSPDMIGQHNPNYPDFIQLGIIFNEEKETFGTEFFDAGGNKITIDSPNDLLTLIPANSEVVCMLQATAGWSSSSGFGVSPKARQIRIFPRDSFPTGQCLLDDPEDEEEDEAEVNEAEPSNAEEEEEEEEEVEEEEAEEEEVEEEEAEEPEPEP